MENQNSITYKEFLKIMRKIRSEAGLKNSEYAESRIRGWGNSSEGIEYQKPRFDWSFRRKGRKIESFSRNPFESMNVNYSSGTRSSGSNFDSRNKAFNQLFAREMPSDVYEKGLRGGYEVRITNELL